MTQSQDHNHSFQGDLKKQLGKLIRAELDGYIVREIISQLDIAIMSFITLIVYLL